ncbi:hypothetical protein FACS189485_02140 [Spirochaetia bacterium]|nr:hypothetical protein FACS189485_02140 [Spirochaetia bacterium]
MDYQEAFNLVTGFYQHSWDQLILVITVAFAVLGVIFPLVLNHINREWYKDRIKNLEKGLKDGFDKLKIELDEYKGKFADLENEYKGKFESLDRHMRDVEGGVLLTQTAVLQGNNNFSQALKSALRALVCFFDFGDENHISAAFSAINKVNNLCPNETKKMFDAKPLVSAIKKIEENNKTGKYNHELERIRGILDQVSAE